MSTIVNNPGTTDRVVERTVETTGDSGAGWAVAVVILLVVVAAGGFFFMRGYQAPAAAPSSTGGDNINVTLPASGSDTSGGTSGGATGGAQQPAPTQ